MASSSFVWDRSGRPLFRTRTGDYLGASGDGVAQALGIRYATAKRFQLPVAVPEVRSDVGADAVSELPVTASDRVTQPLDASTPAPACLQQRPPADDPLFGDVFQGVPFDEDCQRLSVATPVDASPGSALPVMVWIHGGAYISGGGDLPVYNPTTLVREQQVVLVRITYRLGVLGFIGDGRRMPANLGLFDILAALRWVKANIANFGGDPENITLFGQSAGADAIAHLMICDGAEGLFKRVIIESAPLGLRHHKDRMVRAMLNAIGPIGADDPPEAVLAAEQRATAAARWFGLRGAMPFGVQYGHAPLPAETDADDAWRAAASRYDVMLGWNADEGAFIGEGRALLARMMERPHVRAVMVKAITTAIYAKQSARLAKLLQVAGAPVSRYRLSWRPEGSKMGAVHTVELPLLFPDPEAWRRALIIGSTEPEALATLGRPLRNSWGEFARIGRTHSDWPPLQVS